jgi:hypothetical protein
MGPVNTSVTPSRAPTDEEQKIAVNEFIHKLCKDPYSVQDLEIDAPFWNIHGMAHKDWIIRFRCNAKNSFGAYVGIKEHDVMWKDGAIDWPATQDRLIWDSVAEGVANG